MDPQTGDTNRPARAEFPLDFDQRHTLTVIVRGKVPEAVGPRILGVRPVAGLEGAVILRALSGLPYLADRHARDGLLIGLPNGSRLPWTTTVDLLVRRPLQLGRTAGGVYLDVRNLLNHRNVVAVRRDTGEPQADERGIARLAEDGLPAHPETIPYESTRYRASADLNGDGYRRRARRAVPDVPGRGTGLHSAAVRLRPSQAGAPGHRAAVLVGDIRAVERPPRAAPG